jgi:hypothetical protein
LDGICSIDFPKVASEYLGRDLVAVRAIIKEVATAPAIWRDSGKRAGARLDQINRMASASGQDGLKRTSGL